MKAIDFILQSNKLVFSCEIIPPEKGRGIREVFETVESIIQFEPRFINVTYHQPEVVYEERDGVIHRVPKRKKPGTVGICASIKHRYNIEPVPHFVCGGFNKYETEDALIDLHYLGIENIFAVRGDPSPGAKTFVPEKEGHAYADTLVKQIADMNQGHYIEPLDGATPSNFCIGVAGYPEKHYESPNLEKDLRFLKRKVEQGADYIITQMFYEFRLYKDFVEKAREIGITVPILPGLKPVSSRKQLYTLPGSFHISIPNMLVSQMEEARTPAEEFRLGAEYMTKLVEELIGYGVPGLHFFTMGKGRATVALLKNIFKP